MNRLGIYFLFFATQISIIAFIAIRSSRAENLVLDCGTKIGSPACDVTPVRHVLNNNGTVEVLAEGSGLTIMAALDESHPGGHPVSAVERFVFGIPRRMLVKFNGKIQPNAKGLPEEFSSSCSLDAKD